MASYLIARGGVASNALAAAFLQSPLFQQAAVTAYFQRSHLHARRTASTAESLVSSKVSTVKSYEEIPGPKPLPIIGNVWRFLPIIGEYYGKEGIQMHRDLYNKYGPICKIQGLPGRGDMVVVFRPEDVEVILRNEGQWPKRGNLSSLVYYREVTRKDFYEGQAGILSDGPKWLETRSKINPPLLQPRTTKRYIAPIADVAQEFVDRMRTLKDQNDELPPDFINELFKWSLESISYVALDTRLGCLASNLPPNSEAQRMIDAVGDFFNRLFDLELGIPFWKIYPTRSWKMFVKDLDTFLEISTKHINAAIERSKRKSEHGEEGEPSVLEKMLARATPREAAIVANDLLFGGIDTTSYTSASFLNLLSKHQEKQHLLFEELKRFLPNKNDAITEEMLEDMKYLKACVKETFRMASPFNANTRILDKEIVINNYRVPAGVLYLMPTMISNFSEEIYPQSERFIPERWLKSRPSEKLTGSAEDFDAVTEEKRQPFAFIPFGFGPRSCVGRRFAELEVEVLIIKILRNFLVEYKYGDIRYESKVLYRPKDPLRFKITDRNE